MYVLILIVLAHSISHGVSTVAHDFGDRASCVAAAKALEADLRRSSSPDAELHYVCTPRSGAE